MSLALRLDQRDSYAGQLARTLFGQQRYADAASAFQLAAAEDPSCSDWPMGLARCLVEQGLHREAVRAYVAATEIDPTLAQAHNEMGCLEQHPRLAEDAFRAATEAAPDSAAYRANLAISLFRQWRFDDAETHFRQAIRLDPDDLSCAIDLGHMLVELGRYSGAKSVFRKAARALKHEAIMVGPGWQCYEEQLFDDAERMFAHRLVTEHDELIAFAYHGFGLALGKLGQSRPAIIGLRAAISLQPGIAVFHRDLGEALAAAGRGKPAASAYERARQLGTSRMPGSDRGWKMEFRREQCALRCLKAA